MLNLAQRQLLIENRRKSLFFSAARRMPIPGTLIWLTLGWVAHLDIDWRWAVAWGSTGTALFLARTALLRYLLRDDDSQWRIEVAGHVIVATAIALGVLAIIGSVLIFPHLSSERQAVMTMIYCGWFAGGVGVNGAYARWYYAWAVPLMVPLILAWLAQFTLLGAAIAALLTLLSGMLLLTTRHYAAQIVRAHELQFDLADRGEQLEQALMLKASFMAATSHDLRQPVASLSLLNYSLQHCASDADIRAIAAKMSAPIEALQHMLNALMELSQLQSSSLSVRPVDFPVRRLFEQLVEEYRTQIGDKPVQLILEGTELNARTDRDLVERIARNLLSNAVKYTPEGSIRLCYEAGDGCLRFSVSDTGIGIAADARGKVFADYWQADNPPRTRDKGLGLGLAIVDRIVSLMNGRIDLDSEVGRGSTFSVELPVVLLPVEARAAARVAVQAPAHATLAGMRVLVVDDDRLVSDSLRTLLTLSGAQVECCENAEQALTALAGQSVLPDIALADYQLSAARNGLELLRVLRQIHPSIQRVLLTGNTDPAILRDAQRDDARVLHKPVRPEQLLELMASCRPLPAAA